MVLKFRDFFFCEKLLSSDVHTYIIGYYNPSVGTTE